MHRVLDHLPHRFAKRSPLPFRKPRQDAQQTGSLDRSPNVAIRLQREFRNLKIHNTKQVC